jgi:hypothetical protein
MSHFHFNAPQAIRHFFTAKAQRRQDQKDFAPWRPGVSNACGAI